VLLPHGDMDGILNRKANISIGSLLFAFLLGFLLSLTLVARGQSLSSTELALVQEAQEYSQKFTGDYFSDVKDPLNTINTYETICRGYFIRHETQTAIEYIGYGDLANEYTYTEQKPLPKDVASTTDPILATTTDASILNI